MSIDTTINLIQAVNRGITGVTFAPDLADYATVLDTANLPAVITWPSEGENFHQGMGGSYKREDRTYRVLVFIEPLGQNDIPSNTVAAIELLERFKATYLAPQTVTLADIPNYQVTIQVDANKPINDTGIDNLSFSGKGYHGFEWRISVRELWV